jgi:hypothetical protein
MSRRVLGGWSGIGLSWRLVVSLIQQVDSVGLPAGVVFSIATDQLISLFRVKELTDHVDVITRDTDRHVDNTMYPDRLRLWQLKRLDPSVVKYREQWREQNDI